MPVARRRRLCRLGRHADEDTQDRDGPAGRPGAHQCTRPAIGASGRHRARRSRRKSCAPRSPSCGARDRRHAARPSRDPPRGPRPSASAAKPDALDARPLAVGKVVARYDLGVARATRPRRRGRDRGAATRADQRLRRQCASPFEDERIVDEHPSNDTVVVVAIPASVTERLGTAGKFPVPFALSPVLRERDVRMREGHGRVTPARSRRRPRWASARGVRRRCLSTLERSRRSRRPLHAARTRSAVAALLDERDDAAAAARARELRAIARLRRARSAHICSISGVETKRPDEEHLVQIEELPERADGRRASMARRAFCTSVSDGVERALVVVSGRRSRIRATASTIDFVLEAVPVWPMQSVSPPRTRTGSIPLPALEMHAATARGDRRVDAGGIAVEHALPGPRAFGDLRVGRRRVERSGHGDAERSRAPEPAARRQIGPRINQNGPHERRLRLAGYANHGAKGPCEVSIVVVLRAWMPSRDRVAGSGLPRGKSPWHSHRDRIPTSDR